MNTSPSSGPEAVTTPYPDLYAAYLMERRGMSLYATDLGFVTYSLSPGGAMAGGCYIQDIYVRPDQRIKGYASFLADLVVDECRARGITRLYGTSVPSTQGSSAALAAMLAYGFSVLESHVDLIILVKDL